MTIAELLIALYTCGSIAHAPSSMRGPSLPGMMPAGGASGKLDHLECRQCGTDLFDFVSPARSGNVESMHPKGILSGRAHPQRQTSDFVVGGQAINLEAAAYDEGPSDPASPGFAGPHKAPEIQRVLGRRIKVHYLKNPHGREFEVITVSNLTNWVTAGEKVAEHSWFPGYSWQILLCAQCKQHIGWRFEKLKSGDNSKIDFFFGILAKEALISKSEVDHSLATKIDL